MSRRRRFARPEVCLVAALIASALAPSHARAQAATSTSIDTASASPSPSATTATASASPSPSAATATADTPALVEARDHQHRGRTLLEAGNPNAALAEFQRVYDLLEGHPRRFMALSNIGRCYQALGEYDRAMEFYDRYLSEGGPQAEDRAVVEASIAALNDLLGTVEITLQGPPHAEVWIDNRRLREAPGRVRVPGGRHSFELRAPGWQPFRRELQLSAHQTQSLAATMERVRGGLRPTLFVAGAGLTAASAIAGGVFGTIAVVTRAGIDAQVAAGQFGPTHERTDTAPIHNEAVAADICFGIAGAFAIGTVVIAFLTDWHGNGTARRSPSVPHAFIAPTMGSGPGLSLMGWF